MFSASVCLLFRVTLDISRIELNFRKNVIHVFFSLPNIEQKLHEKKAGYLILQNFKVLVYLSIWLGESYKNY